MKRSVFSAFVVCAALAAGPALAQQSAQGQMNAQGQQGQMGAQAQQGHLETVPLAMKQQTIRQVQQALNKKGFDAGKADGNWGPETAAAVKNFQEKNGLQQTGALDSQTMQELGINMPSSGNVGSSSGGQQTIPGAGADTTGNAGSIGGQQNSSGGAGGAQQGR